MYNTISVSRNLDPYEESALLWYMGSPNEMFSWGLGDAVSNAKKIYVTINSLLGTDKAEEDRFYEGKKQVPELITSKGIQKIFELISIIYFFRDGEDIEVPKLTRLARQSEMTEGKEVSTALRSATKLTAKECMALGYGDKNGLAICEYELAPGSVHFDYERLGEKYAKSEEREVLIAPGNELETTFLGYSEEFKGRDGKPAALYHVRVTPWNEPDFLKIITYPQVVFDNSYIAKVKKYYQALNDNLGAETAPTPPESFYAWKKALREWFINLLQFIH